MYHYEVISQALSKLEASTIQEEAAWRICQKELSARDQGEATIDRLISLTTHVAKLTLKPLDFDRKSRITSAPLE